MRILLGRSLAVLLFVSLTAIPAFAEFVPSLPPFSLETIQGGQVTDQDLQGPALLFFCMPGYLECETALTELGWILPGYPEISGLVVAPIETLALTILEETYAVPWPAVADTQFLFASVFQIREMPTIVLLLDGQVVGRLDPGYSSDDLHAALGALVERVETGGPEPAAPSVQLGFMKVQAPFLLMFAGADCPYCHVMLPEVFDIAGFFDTRVVVVEPLAEPGPFQSDAERLSIALDPDWYFADLFDVRTTPTVFFFNQQGRLIWWHEGFAEGISLVAQAIAMQTTAASEAE